MDSEILALCESFWSFQLRESPELSTYTGYHTANDKLDVFTVQAYENRKVGTCNGNICSMQPAVQTLNSTQELFAYSLAQKEQCHAMGS